MNTESTTIESTPTEDTTTEPISLENMEINYSLQYALDISGNGIIRKKRFIEQSNPLSEFVYVGNTKKSLVFDINKIRMTSGLDPVVIEGSFYKKLTSATITVIKDDKPISRPITFADRDEMITEPAISFETDFDGEEIFSQNIYLILTQSCGLDGNTRPTYNLVVDNGTENPIEIKVDVWKYSDGTIALEAARDGFAAVGDAQGNKVYLDSNKTNKNNFKQVVGWILKSIELTEVELENSTGVEFANRLEHLSVRTNSRKPTNSMVSIPKKKVEKEEEVNPFNEMETGIVGN